MQQSDGLIPCKVMSPLKSGGKKYAVGALVELPDDEAMKLYELGVVAEPDPVVIAPEKLDQDKPEETGGSQRPFFLEMTDHLKSQETGNSQPNQPLETMDQDKVEEVEVSEELDADKTDAADTAEAADAAGGA